MIGPVNHSLLQELFTGLAVFVPVQASNIAILREVLVEPGLRADIAETSMAHPGPPNSYQPWHLRSCWSPCSSSSSNPSPAGGVDSPDFSTPTSSPPYYSDPAEIGRSFMSLTFPGLQQSCRNLSREDEHHPKGLCLQPRELIRFCICRG